MKRPKSALDKLEAFTNSRVFNPERPARMSNDMALIKVIQILIQKSDEVTAEKLDAILYELTRD